jgi:hypothetical protein
MDRHQPALLGGVFIGVLSALPFVGAGNCCCCLWVVLGGMLVAYLEQQRLDGPLEVATAVRSGLFAGLIGAAITVVLEMVFSAALKPWLGPAQQKLAEQVIDMIPNLPPDIRDQLSNPQPATRMAAGRIVGLFFMMLIDGLFAMLGALLGSAMFKKKTPPAPLATDA